MSDFSCRIRTANPKDFAPLGQIMVTVYSNLEGFFTREEQPEFYEMLANIGALAEKPDVKLLIAQSPTGEICGGVVYYKNMAHYGSGGTATKEKQASGFRLLAVSPDFQKRGIAKKLATACIEQARLDGNEKMVIHTTNAMKVAWSMYEKIGFKRAQDLDFKQGEYPIYGFRLTL